VTFRLANTGRMDADEIPQVYLDAPGDSVAGVTFAPRSLVAFERIALKAGEARTVTLHVALRQLQYWSPARHAWLRARGKRRVRVGPSSRDLRLERSID
jgi:beta-glucosidase